MDLFMNLFSASLWSPNKEATKEAKTIFIAQRAGRSTWAPGESGEHSEINSATLKFLHRLCSVCVGQLGWEKLEKKANEMRMKCEWNGSEIGMN